MLDFFRPHESLFSWPIFGLVLIGLTIFVSNAFLDTTTWQLETQRSLSGPIEKPQSVQGAPGLPNWKMYRSERYGFEVRYPADKLQVTGATTRLPHANQPRFDGVEFSHLILTGKTTRDTCYYEYSGIPYPCKSEIKDTSFYFFVVSEEYEVFVSRYKTDSVETIGGRRWAVSDIGVEGDGSLYYFAPIGGDKTVVASRAYNNEFDNKRHGDYDESLFNQILSTFRFIEPVDTSNWKTYRNEEYGFALSYPTDWKLTEYSPDSIILDPPNNPGIAKTYFGLSIQNKTLGTIREATPQKITREEVVVAGRASDKYIYDPSHVSIYIPFNDRVGVYGIDLYTPPGVDEPNQILSTFKLIESR